MRSRAAELSPRELATEIFSRPFARRYGPEHEFEVIHFIPSYFASPHKAVLFDETTCLVVADCRIGPHALQQIRDVLSSALKAVADSTHLEILRAEGLLAEQAEGAVKYQRLRRERLEELLAELKRYLYEEL